MSINLIIISRNQNAGDFIQNVKDYNIAPPENTTVIYPDSNNYETTLIIPFLDDTKYNVIIYDWSITQNNNLNTIISDIISSKTFDVVYLGKYLDTCNKYLVDSNIQNISFVSGTEPVGFNALIVSPTFTPVLKAELQTSKYYSIIYALQNIDLNSNVGYFAISPNLFVYNPLYNQIDSSKAYGAKTEECQPFTSQITPPSDNQLEVFWIILIILIVALILWFLVGFTTFGIKSKEFAYSPTTYISF
jgi:hypothetical protein